MNEKNDYMKRDSFLFSVHVHRFFIKIKKIKKKGAPFKCNQCPAHLLHNLFSRRKKRCVCFIMPYHTTYLRINAKDALNQPAESFEVNLPGSWTQYSGVVGARVVYVCMPNHFYNVELGENTFVYYYLDSSLNRNTATVTVDPGQYTFDQLAAALVAKDSNITVVTQYSDPNTNPKTKFGDHHIEITFNYTHSITIPAENNPLAKLMGFYNDLENHVFDPYDITINQPINPNVYEFKSTHPPSLYGARTLYIHCPELSFNYGDTASGGFQTSTLCHVPMDVAFGEIKHQEYPTDYVMTFPERSIHTLHFEVRDDQAKLVNLRGEDWTIILQIKCRL